MTFSLTMSMASRQSAEGIPSQRILMGDAAFVAMRDRCKSAQASFPNTPSRALKYRLKPLHTERHLIPCCLSRMQRFRRVATRYERRRKITSWSSLKWAVHAA